MSQIKEELANVQKALDCLTVDNFYVSKHALQMCVNHLIMAVEQYDTVTISPADIFDCEDGD